MNVSNVLHSHTRPSILLKNFKVCAPGRLRVRIPVYWPGRYLATGDRGEFCTLKKFTFFVRLTRYLLYSYSTVDCTYTHSAMESANSECVVVSFAWTGCHGDSNVYVAKACRSISDEVHEVVHHPAVTYESTTNSLVSKWLKFLDYMYNTHNFL